MDKLTSYAYKSNLRRLLLLLVIFLIASGVGYIFRSIHYPDTNIVVIYLLAVLITVWFTRSFLFGFIASILATFLFNYFFTEPIFGFSVENPYYIVTFFTMTTAALITSTLTAHAHRSAEIANEKEAESRAIYNLTNRLTDATDISDIAGITVFALSEYFSCNVGFLCFDENNMPEKSFIQQAPGGRQISREIDDIDEMKRRIDGLQTGYYTDGEFTDWPVHGRENTLGVVRVPIEKTPGMNDAQMQLLRSMIESTALAMDRIRSAELRIKSREEISKERYRANLLRSISHDIRTPLSGIIGTAEILMDITESDDPRYELARGIQASADWLHSMVENILNLTRLQEGQLPIIRQREAVEEIVGGAVTHITARAPNHEISVNVPDEPLFVPMDAKLIEQVLINLLDNSVRHTEPGKEISIDVKLCENVEMVEFGIKDTGTGICKQDLPNIFQAFYVSHADHEKHGVGLGLAICETIVQAHGGSIEAHNRKDGPGAEFIFRLPLEGPSDE